ncbi:PLP-dependent aminotransferase family protein [Microbacterium invictum]|uniref:PLP-dependent aminotransferase family protein n=1 Tax=Microbacterium invictum TaxID=515415 RepID=A0ABZ0V7Q0_9MICO|nr:PLP-dependent aminotransferase family protein [Microbacterium invictum]WQB68807.1 PLP-dependent aminotransferase family protein [Microbacterium invictum]
MDSRMSARALSHALGGWRTREPTYEALADGIRLLCLDNRLAPRTTLPAERELAAVLGLSRSTVAAAYASLRGTGHIHSVRGSGSMTLPVARRDPGITSRVHRDDIDLQQASPAAWPGLAGLMAETIADAPSIVARSGYDIVGRHQLRVRVAEHYTARGVTTSPDEILITTGAQSAIHLLARSLVTRGDRVLIETPTYPHAADALRQAGARLTAVPVTITDGWDLERAEQVSQRTLPVAAYVMPDFHNPTGRSMSAHERAALARSCERAGTTLILDETTGDLDIDRGPLDRGFDRMDPRLVVRIGSLGKTVWGGLRIGWIRATPELIRRLVALRSAQDLGTPELEQVIASAVLGRFGDVVDQRRHMLRAGRDVMSAALNERLPRWTVPRPSGGVSLWIEMDAPLSAAVVMDARHRGLLLTSGPRFSVDGGHDRYLRVPFTAAPETLVRAADILAESWTTVSRAAPPTLMLREDAMV